MQILNRSRPLILIGLLHLHWWGSIILLLRLIHYIVFLRRGIVFISITVYSCKGNWSALVVLGSVIELWVMVLRLSLDGNRCGLDALSKWVIWLNWTWRSRLGHCRSILWRQLSSLRLRSCMSPQSILFVNWSLLILLHLLRSIDDETILLIGLWIAHRKST